MKLTPCSEAYQKLVFSQQRENAEKRPKGLAYATRSTPQEDLIVLKGFFRFVDKLHLPLTFFIAFRNTLVLGSSALKHNSRCFDASVGTIGNNESCGQEGSAAKTKTALAKLFLRIFLFTFSANVNSGQLSPI